MIAPITGYSHERCYAKLTRDCSEKISKEHVIFNSILTQFEKEFKIANVPGTNTPNTFVKRSSGSLTSKILCEKHNSLLGNEIVGEFVRFFTTINEIDKKIVTNDTQNEQFDFCGEKLEKGFLNLACNLIASKWARQEGTNGELHMKPEYVGILFNNQPFPDLWGMYIIVNQTYQHQKCYSAAVYKHEDELKAVRFWINNIPITLMLGRPDNECGAYRPHLIIFKSETCSKTICINWSDARYNDPNRRPIELTYTNRTANDVPPEWESWMKT